MKKLNLLLLVLFSAISLNINAYDFEAVNSDGKTIYYNIISNTDLTVEVTSGSTKYSGDINIPSSVSYNGEIYSVKAIHYSAFRSCYGLTSVTIPNSVTAIGEDAFYYCSGLTSVTIPNSVTSIGNSAFFYCTGLTSVTIGNSVTTIGNYAFYNCTGLTSITIPNSVTSIGVSAFNGCTGLTSITIPNSVTSIGNSAFNNCSKLTEINIDLENSNFSSIDGVLFNKDKTELIIYPKGKQGEYVIPNSVTSIGNGAFSGCTGLTSVTIGDSVTSIGDFAFSNCSGLTSITIPNSVTSIGNWAFNNCSKLTEINVDLENSNFLSIDGVLFNKNKTELIKFPVGKKGGYVIPNSVTSIGDYAFSGCTGLTSITIPNSVTSIGDFAFSNCSGLTSITIPNSVTSIGEDAFYYCSGLTSITIPNSVTSIGNSAFFYCTGLTSITIPNSVTSIGDYAFRGCSKLADLRFEDGEQSLSLGYNLESSSGTGEGLFYDCPLKTLYLGREISYDADKKYGYSPFYNKTALTSVTIGDSVTSIGDYAFCGCTGLTSVNIGDDAESIGVGAFSSCKNIMTAVIGKSVKTIGDYAFNECNWLTSLTMSPVVESIGDSAFYNCGRLSSLTIPKTTTSIGDYAFSKCLALENIISESTTIAPKAFSTSFSGVNTEIPVYIFTDKSEYQNADGWKVFTNFILPVPATFTVPNEDNVLITYFIPTIEQYNNREVYVVAGDEKYRGSIVIPETVEYENKEFTVTTIGSSAFKDCTTLLSVELPSTISVIEDEAFYGCSRLRSMDTRNSIEYIGIGAFEGCSALKSLILGESLKSISAFAFADCSNLTSISSLNPTPPVCDEDAFYGLSTNVSSLTKSFASVNVFVPIGSASAYKSANIWKNFSYIEESDFVGIEDIEIDANKDKANAYISGEVLMFSGIDMPTNVAVYNMSGTNVANVVITPDNCSIDLSDLPKGIYIVVTDNKKQKVVL